MPNNILFFLNGLGRGGTEMRLLDFTRYFPKDLKIFICVTGKDLALLKEFQEQSIDIKVIPIKKSYLEFNKINDVYRYIQINNITIINVFNIKELFVAELLKLLKDRKLKIIYNVVHPFVAYDIKQKLVLRFLLKFVDIFICNSYETKRCIWDTYLSEDKVKLIYNGIDTSYFNRNRFKNPKLRENLGIDNSAIVIGTMANFRKEKNYPFLLKAFKILLRKYPNLILLCVGGGKYLDKTRSIARKYDLDRKVVFSGYQNNPAEYLYIMDIFVLTSLYEGFPNALLQAMSMELPVITSAVGGCKEIINNLNDGILFRSNDLDDFIRGISYLIEDKEFAAELAHNARIKIEEKFSLKSMTENYVEFYRRVTQL